MPYAAIAGGVAIAAFVAWAGATALARFGRVRGLDAVGGSLRKVHVYPTPRVGGIAVALAVLSGVLAESVLSARTESVLLLLCVAPGLVWGLIEDFRRRGASGARLALNAVAAGLAFILLDARLTQVGVPVLDELLALHAISFLFTLFAVAGVANAMNVIDGLNGLSGATALLAAAGLALVAWTVGDSFVFGAACILAAGVCGFLAVNFPSGRILLGDGGAYLIGLLLAELSVLLVHRNSEVSPWFPLVLLAFPVWETLFSMYRRRYRGHPAGRADALHLHFLVYRRIVRWRGYEASKPDYVARNSLASVYLWWIPAACLMVAVVFWHETLILQAAALAFGMLYAFTYRAIVRFGVPARLVVRGNGATARTKRSGARLPGRRQETLIRR